MKELNMRVVFIIKGMDSAPYEDGSWICGVFDTEEKALAYKKELEAEEDADYYIYMLSQWEVR